jgi:hypothetical protein
MMPNQVNFIASSMINLFLGDLNIQSFNTFGFNSRAFARIPVTVPYGVSTVYRPIESVKFILERKLLNDFNIRFTDEHGVELNLTYHMQLSVQQVRPLEDDVADISTIPWFYRTVLQVPYGDDVFEESELATN